MVGVADLVVIGYKCCVDCGTWEIDGRRKWHLGRCDDCHLAQQERRMALKGRTYEVDGVVYKVDTSPLIRAGRVKRSVISPPIERNVRPPGDADDVNKVIRNEALRLLRDRHWEEYEALSIVVRRRIEALPTQEELDAQTEAASVPPADRPAEPT